MAQVSRLASPTTNEIRLITRQFVLLCFSCFLVLSSYFAFFPTLPLYVKSLGGDDALVGLVVGVIAISSASCRLLVGPLADLCGRKPLYAGSAIVLLSSALLFNFATTVPLLIAVRLLQGVGFGVAQTVASLMVIDIAPIERRVEAVGWLGVAMNVGIALTGPAALALVAVGGPPLNGFGLVFVLSAVVGLLGLLCVEFIRETRPEGTPVDSRPLRAVGDVLNIAALPPTATAFLLTWGFVAFTTFLSLYASPQNAAAYFFAYSVAMLVSRPFTGMAADRIGRAKAVLPATVLMIGGNVILALSTDLVPVVVAATMFGVGFGVTYACLMVLATESTSPNRRGSAMGTYTAGCEIPVLVAAVALGGVATSAGYPAVFLTAAGVGFLGLLWFVAYYYYLSPRSRLSPSTPDE